MTNFNLGVVLVLLSATGFAVIPFFAIEAYAGGATVTSLLVVRFLITTVFFFSYLFLTNKKPIVQDGQIKHLFLLGGVLYTIMSTCYFASVKYIPASLAVLLLYLYPVFVAVGSTLFEKESLTSKIILSIGFSLMGLFLVLGNSFNQINIYGVLLAVGASISYSSYILLGNKVVKQIPVMITSAYVSLFAFTSLFIIGLATGNLYFNLTPGAWAAMGGVAVCSTIIPMFTFFKGMDLIGSTRASILSMIEPLITISLSALLLSERLTFIQLFGGLIVLIGAVLVVLAPKPSKVSEAA
ncbi:DMT family transporter [Desulforamulus aquiferis]|uniref:DMT family transporter n=1 Tax=Desulforamulus aquiferis TaxID=1397668 RepID=A0AAW7ZB30_9FIRM|nr:DMT family transporter [Desulforamulus aquiferis]MDO7786923.1 DMT family transporter [Desulforamulus aquiferis]RYD03541.1 hypothetical protein N752_19225 [Desulforamulus aquiferis]